MLRLASSAANPVAKVFHQLGTLLAIGLRTPTLGHPIMIRSHSAPHTASLTLLDQAIFVSVSAMSMFALFSPLFWGLS